MKYVVRFHIIVPEGATTARRLRELHLHAVSEREAVLKARSIIKNDGGEPDGHPEVQAYPAGS